MRSIGQLFEKKWFCGCLYLLGIIMVACRYRYSFRSGIWLDPAILMTEVESIARGYIPYETMHLNYPPLFFYLMVGLKRLFHVPYGCYNFYLVVNYVLLFGSAVCLAVIGRRITGKKVVSDFSAWLYLLVMARLSADSVMLAVPSIFFGLLSCTLCVLLSNQSPLHLIYIGFIAACSFLVKQFGGGFFALVLLLVFCYGEKRKWGRSFLFILGYLIPIAIVFLIFGSSFIRSTLLNGYGTTTTFLTAEDLSIRNRFALFFSLTWTTLIESFLVLLSVLCLLPVLFKQSKMKAVAFCMCGFIGFSLQYFFCYSGHPHYRQYMAPFAMLMIPVLLSLDYRKNIIAMAVCLIGIGGTAYRPVREDLTFCVKLPIRNYCENGRQNQQRQAEEIRNHITEGATLWIASTDLMLFHYFLDLPTPNMREVGFSAGPFEMTEESAELQVRSADYVLCFPQGGYADEIDYYLKPLRPYLESFQCDTITENMLLYNMHDPIEKGANK